MLRQIGRQLRDLYADLEHQPLPTRLAEILGRIERMGRDEKR